MAGWEYCLVKQHFANEFWVCGPDGKKEKLKGKELCLPVVLGQLGAEGWEAVGFMPSAQAMEAGGQSFTMWPGNTGTT